MGGEKRRWLVGGNRMDRVPFQIGLLDGGLEPAAATLDRIRLRPDEIAGLLACDGDETRYSEFRDWAAAWFGREGRPEIGLCARGGTILIGMVRLWRSPHVGDRWFVEGLMVAPAWRRRGVAAQLLQQAFPLMDSFGVPELRAHVSKANTASQLLFEKLGFARGADAYLNSWGEPRDGVGWEYRKDLAASRSRGT